MSERPEFITVGNTSIAYHHFFGSETVGVMFLGGFMSNMQGAKALALEAYCRERNIPFTRFDYGGHGQSSGTFEEGTIGEWQRHAQAVFDHTATRKTLLVGSSMGGWMMLLLALARPERVAGLVGLASAPDFTEKLIYEEFTPQQLQEMQATGRVMIRNCMPGEADYPITWKLIEEGRKHLLTEKQISITCPAHLIHGMRDADVPYTLSLQLAEQLEREDVGITLIKNGDHRLSSPDNLALLCRIVDFMLKKTQ